MTEIVDLDATALSEAIRTRGVSCREVMCAYLDRIERINPKYNAIVSVQPREALLAQADERDAMLARGQWLGWMHGMPQAIKDISPVRGMRTTRGSPLYAQQVPAVDGLMVARMRASGAIFVGRTNVPEFGLGSHTYNGVFGTTVNAYDPTRCAGGSSGGAAVALALKLLPVADGSDVGGSLRNPAAFNNVYGMRPSQGRVPMWPALDVWLSQLGTEGPMARNVCDLARLLSVQAGWDRHTPLALGEDPAVFAQPLEHDVKGWRIGWLGDLGRHLPIENGVLDLCRSALGTLRDLGCHVDEVRLGFDPERIWKAFLTLRSANNVMTLGAHFDDPKQRAQMKPEAQWEVESGLGVSAVEFNRASQVRTQWYEAALALFSRFDFLAIPTAQVFPFDAATHWPREVAGRTMDTYHRWMEVVVPWTMAGLPAISVPVGFGAQGLPMGMQLIGAPRDDLGVLRLAHAYDRATDWVRRRPPAL